MNYQRLLMNDFLSGLDAYSYLRSDYYFGRAIDLKRFEWPLTSQFVSTAANGGLLASTDNQTEL